MNNTETLTTSDTLDTAQNVFMFCCVLCIRCCQCICVVPSVYSSVYFVLCLMYPMLRNNTETLVTSYAQDTTKHKH
jgi:hypothetical protein